MKGIVLILLSTFCLSEASTMDQVLAASQKLPSIDINALEKEILSVVASGSSMTASRNVIEQTMKMLDDEILGELQKSLTADTDKMQSLKNKFQSCNSIYSASVVKSKKLIADAKSLKNGLTECRDLQADLTKREVQCLGELKAEQATQKLKCDYYEEVKNDVRNLLKQCVTQGPKYPSFVGGNKQAFNAYRDKRAAAAQACAEARQAVKKRTQDCETLKSNLKSTKKKCKQVQGDYESNTCAKLELRKSGKLEVPSCYDPAFQAWKAAIFQLRQNEKARLHDWRALQRIKCLLTAVAGDSADLGAKIEECRGKTYTTKKYNLQWWNPPYKPVNLPQETFACTNEFLLFYKGLAAKADMCKWCSGYKPTPQPTPLPTPWPTPFPTPRPTPRPTPWPTPRPTNPCYVAMYWDWHYQGGGQGYYGDVNWIGSHWNDQVSSFSLEGGCCVTFYEDIYYGGNSGCWCSSSNWIGNYWNDRMSSFKVARGYCPR